MERSHQWVDNDLVLGKNYMREQGYFRVSAPSSSLGLSILECLSLSIVLLVPLPVPLLFFERVVNNLFRMDRKKTR